MHWGYFDAALKPSITVDPGDTVVSLAADVRVTQAANGSKGIHVMLEKALLQP